jgi:hypothetical protein
MEPEGSLSQSQGPTTCPYPEHSLSVSQHDTFLRWGIVNTSPHPQAGGPPIVGCPDCLFNIFAATLHILGRSSIRYLRRRRSLVTGTHLTSWKPLSFSRRTVLHGGSKIMQPEKYAVCGWQYMFCSVTTCFGLTGRVQENHLRYYWKEMKALHF